MDTPFNTPNKLVKLFQTSNDEAIAKKNRAKEKIYITNNGSVLIFHEEKMKKIETSTSEI